MHTMTIYTANCRQNKKNIFYPHEARITNLNELLEAVSMDNIMSAMKNGQRSKENFLKTDGIYLDLDNTHSEDPETWKALDDIADALPEVEFYYVKSRNYMKVKQKTDKAGNVTNYEAREKYHLYFPLKEEISSYTDAENLMLEVCGLFPFFDFGAAKPAQFFFGVEKPEGGQYDGQYTIDEYVKDNKAELLQQIETNIKDYESNLESGNYEGGETLKAFHKLCSHFGIKTQNAEANTPPADLEALGDNWLDKMEQEESIKWFLKWAADYNQEIITRYHFGKNSASHPYAEAFGVNCPWCNEHSEDTGEKQTVVIIDRSAKLSFLCRHNSCISKKRDWKQYRQKVEADNPQVQKETRTNEPDPAPQPQIVDIKPVGEYIDLFRKHREAYKNNLRTGFLSLDMVLGGGFGNELYVLASETGSGKSAIASVLAQNIAKSGVDVYYFALEMGRDEFIARGASMISAENDMQSAIPFGEILGDTFDPQINDFYRRAYSQYETHVKEYTRRYGEHLYVIECSTVGTTAGAIIDTVKELRKDKKGRFMVFIDYLQLITADPADRTQRDKMIVVSAATMAFKAFASQYGAAVFLLSSMANDKTGKNISETSFKYSGDIAFTGGVLLAWTWEGVTNTSDEERRSYVIEESKRLGYREMTINVLKHRNGAKQGKARLIYYPAFNYIVEADAQAQTQGSARTNGSITSLAKAKGKKRDIQREELQKAFEGCERGDDGFTVTLGAMADYMDKSKAQVKRLIKEYGGYSIEQDGAVIFSGETQEPEVKALLPDGVFADSGEDPGES